MPNWSEVIEKHGPLVWMVIRRLVSQEADAADCFQEVFTAALQLSRKQKILSWTATLRHLATVKAMDCLRKKYRNSAIQSVSIPSEIVDSRGYSPDSNAITGELADALRMSLACIDPRQAEIFCMVCLEAMTYQEASVVVGIQENHVGVLLNRARTALKQRLQAHAPTSRSLANQGAHENESTKR